LQEEVGRVRFSAHEHNARLRHFISGPPMGLDWRRAPCLVPTFAADRTN
jgi:hypothetical protein